ncbi:MAG: hypothetical protein H6813_06775 [Phycisphaeraceae bacterium]|nr:hypothetical protein [Phycisphaeraceae bacterium]
MNNPDDNTVIVLAYALGLTLLLGYAAMLLIRLARESRRTPGDSDRTATDHD